MIDPRWAWVHETAVVHPSAVVGGPPQWRGRPARFRAHIRAGATVGPLCQIDAGCERPTVVGEGSWVLGMVHVGHGAQIGRRCEVSTGTVLAGEVTIGDDVRIGVGALLKPYVSVGRGARVGMGAVVTSDVPPHTCVAGNPARVLYRLDPTTGDRLDEPDTMDVLREAAD